jgi:high affinity Mn2+ porin
MRIGILSSQTELWRVGWAVLLTLCSCGTGLYGQGDDSATAAQGDQNSERWSVHAQATGIGQTHGSFTSPYSGVNSLDPRRETKASLTSTLFLGLRLRKGLELYVNPEVAGGEGFSSVLGIAGFPNGEITRVTSATPKAYLSRAFMRQTWSLSGAADPVAGGPNQLAGNQPISGVTLTFGKISAPDIFDTNSYSHDPRTQFMNWSFMENGAWDYPADTRGYTWGFALELNQSRWAFRVGSFLVPTYANGLPLDRHVRRNNGDVAELELRHAWRGQPGKVKFLGYVNYANMGTYREALLEHAVNPNITHTRRSGTAKYGLGLNAEQALSPTVGAFLRLGWDDGKTETWAFTEIDRTIHGGLQVQGKSWHRAQDVVGLAGVVNGLSRDHREYLAVGGHGFIIGDGKLNYSTERILESYYAFQVHRMVTVTLDYQFAGNPAFNRDRGPVSIWALRLHWAK